MDKESHIKPLRDKGYVVINKGECILGGFLLSACAGLIGLFIGTEPDSHYKNHLTDLATQNHVVYDMPNGNR